MSFSSKTLSTLSIFIDFQKKMIKLAIQLNALLQQLRQVGVEHGPLFAPIPARPVMQEYAVVYFAKKFTFCVSRVHLNKFHQFGVLFQAGRHLVHVPGSRPQVLHEIHAARVKLLVGPANLVNVGHGATHGHLQPFLHHSAHIAVRTAVPVQQLHVLHSGQVKIVNAVPNVVHVVAALQHHRAVVCRVLGDVKICHQKHVAVQAQVLARIFFLVLQNEVHGIGATNGGRLLGFMGIVGHVDAGDVQRATRVLDLALHRHVVAVGEVGEVLGVVEHDELVIAAFEMFFQRVVLHFNENRVIHHRRYYCNHGWIAVFSNNWNCSWFM